MFRIVRGKIFPLIVLILLLIIFFAPEINLLIHTGEDFILNTCLIQKIANRPCEKIIVDNIGPATVSLGLSQDNPVFKFSTNMKLESIDKQNSKIDILLIYAERYHQKVVDLTDNNVAFVTKGEMTEITYTYTDKITEIVPVIPQLYLYDKQGNAGYSAMYSSVAQNWVDYLTERILYLMQYLVWYFAIFGGAIRGIPWSIVYDSKTKEPIKGAIVRMFKDNRLYNTVISDVNGIIKVQPEKGVYILNVIYAGYQFPSSLKPLRVDSDYTKLYYGEEINIANEHTNLKISIPLDSQSYVEKSSIFTRSLRSLTSTLDLIVPYFMIFMVVLQIVIWPTYLITWIYAVIVAILLGLQYYLRHQVQGQSGLILNNVGTPLVDIKVDLYEAEWNKKVDTIVTNDKGEFEFIVPIKKYYIKLDNTQYKIQGRETGENYEISTKGVIGRVLRVNPKLVLEKVKAAR